MKIALDPWMIRRLPLDEVCAATANAGYGYLELSPRDDFLPLFTVPRANPARIAELNRALRTHSLELASFWTVYRWSDAHDAEARAAAVRYWRKAIQIAVELNCRNINSEFGGDPDAYGASEAAFLRSVEELVPLLEAEGITMSIEAHPGDFVEDGLVATDLIKAIDSPRLRYLYCAPHTFHLGHDLATMLRAAAPVLAHVHVADTLDHRQSLRYIVNPPSASVRIHQHLNIGEGEVDWELFFSALAEVGFDGILTACVFAWEDRAAESFRRMRAEIARRLGQADGAGGTSAAEAG